MAAPIHGRLRGGCSGRVLASFERSIYLETDGGEVIAVLAESLGRGAFAVTVRGAPSFTALRPGAPVRAAGGLLRLDALEIDLEPAAPWDPSLPRRGDDPGEGLTTLSDFLLRHAPAEGLSRLLDPRTRAPLLDRARPAVQTLLAGLAGGHVPAIAAGAAGLAGLGPGLTPSGDDVLAGILLAVHLWPERAGRLGREGVAALVVEAAIPRTGRISQAYLSAARRGLASDPWHALTRALPGPEGPLLAAGARILQIGETSGADMLAGFLLGGRALPQR